MDRGLTPVFFLKAEGVFPSHWGVILFLTSQLSWPGRAVQIKTACPWRSHHPTDCSSHENTRRVQTDCTFSLKQQSPFLSRLILMDTTRNVIHMVLCTKSNPQITAQPSGVSESSSPPFTGVVLAKHKTAAKAGHLRTSSFSACPRRVPGRGPRSRDATPGTGSRGNHSPGPSLGVRPRETNFLSPETQPLILKAVTGSSLATGVGLDRRRPNPEPRQSFTESYQLGVTAHLSQTRTVRSPRGERGVHRLP